MRDFSYAQATSRADAIALARLPDTVVLAGGTELLNWTRIGIVEPARIVDITRISGMEGVDALPNGGVRIGALTKLNDAAQHPLIRASYPVFSEAILKYASAQIRNLATVGANARRGRIGTGSASAAASEWSITASAPCGCRRYARSPQQAARR